MSGSDCAVSDAICRRSSKRSKKAATTRASKTVAPSAAKLGAAVTLGLKSATPETRQRGCEHDWGRQAAAGLVFAAEFNLRFLVIRAASGRGGEKDDG